MMAAVVGIFATFGLAGLCALAGYGAGIRKGSEKGFELGYQRAVREQEPRGRVNKRRTP